MEVKKLDNSEVEISAEISSEAFARTRGEAMKNLKKLVKIDGFREGTAPDNIVERHVGSGAILEEMADIAVRNNYQTIMEEAKVEAIGRPILTITKIAVGEPLGIKIKTAVMPVIKLPDYKSIAKKETSKGKESFEPTEKEIEDVLGEIKKMRTAEGGAPADLTDEFVKTLGKFENVEDFKNRIKTNIKLEKEIKARDKKRVEILEGIVSKLEVVLPSVLIEVELDKMVADLKNDLSHSGIDFADYVAKTGKTESILRDDIRPSAEKRAKFGLILSEIGKLEKLEVEKEELERETEAMLSHFKGADPERAGHYVEGQLMNEKVFQFIENIK
ncbi:MAG: trigger factor [Patescibacteria group bacterium]